MYINMHRNDFCTKKKNRSDGNPCFFFDLNYENMIHTKWKLQFLSLKICIKKNCKKIGPKLLYQDLIL